MYAVEQRGGGGGGARGVVGSVLLMGCRCKLHCLILLASIRDVGPDQCVPIRHKHVSAMPSTVTVLITAGWPFLDPC